ncbi:MarC family protein [Alsobacter sp. R-9]
MGEGLIGREVSLFVGVFSTLLAIINPFEVLPVFLKLLAGKDEATHRAVARRACLYGLALCFFFLIFGNLLMRLFDVPLSMVRIVGGIILMKIGFDLFAPPPASKDQDGEQPAVTDGVAFVPLAMPLMVGPGAIATVLGMTSTIRNTSAELAALVAVAAAIVATMLVTYACLAYADRLTKWLGPLGLDAATRIVGFFVAAMGVGLIFNGVIEALQSHGVTSLR